MNKKQILTLILVATLTGSVFAGPNENLLSAIKKNDLSDVQNALKTKVDSKTKGQALITALYQQNEAMAQTILGSNPAVNVTNKNGTTPLMFAAIAGYTDIINDLIKKGARVNAQDKKGKTALMMAAENNHQESIQALINNKANINIQDHSERTALMYCTINNQIESIKTLIKAGADTEITDKLGNAAFNYALYPEIKNIFKNKKQ